MVGEVADIQDKGEGKNAVVMLKATGTNPDTGKVVAETMATAVIRGEGGFGGQPGQRPGARDPRPRARLTDRAATREDQALIYRLSGDRNPPHSDPGRACRIACRGSDNKTPCDRSCRARVPACSARRTAAW